MSQSQRVQAGRVPRPRLSTTARKVSFADLHSTGVDSAEPNEDIGLGNESVDANKLSQLLVLFSDITAALRKETDCCVEKGWIFDEAVDEVVAQSEFTKRMLKNGNARMELLRIFILEWMDHIRSVTDFQWAYTTVESFLLQYPDFSNLIYTREHVDQLLLFANWAFLVVRALKTGKSLKRQLVTVLCICIQGEERLPSSAQQIAARNLILTTEINFLKQIGYSPVSSRRLSLAKEAEDAEPNVDLNNAQHFSTVYSFEPSC